MKPIVPAHIYEIEFGTIVFTHTGPDGVACKGTTTCEILEVLIHRIATFDALHPCDENMLMLHGLHAAHGAARARDARVAKQAKEPS